MKKEILCPAKINLFLDVVSKRDDGYHNICSVMQSVSLYDTIMVEISDSDKAEIFIESNDTSIAWDKTNLVYKAAQLFLEMIKAQSKKISIRVDKKIPIGAGLAGGSTDAAGTLIALNELFSLPLNEKELCEMGQKLGADIPFCITGGTCLCEGTGEIISKLSSIKGHTALVSIGGERISTPYAYSQIDKMDGYENLDPEKMLKAIEENDFDLVCSDLYNIFEKAIEPLPNSVKEIKNICLTNGAKGALMSGSGPATFALFDDERKAKDAKKELDKRGYLSFLCKTL